MVKLLAICFSLILLLMNAHNVKGQTSQTFTATGSFTVPAGVTSITVECWGAGGGGGGASTTNPCAGGGGGGGSYARSIISVTPGNSYTVTVGTAGTAGAAGATGGTGGYSWFYSSSTILAAGGTGGVGVTTGSGSGGSGGSTSSSIGTTLYAGGNGAAGVSTTGGGGGGGGAGNSNPGGAASGSTGGTGGVTGGGNGANGQTGNGNGSAGTVPGGGGSGARRTSGNRTGGAGSRGQIIITYTIPSTSATSALITPSITCTGSAVTLSRTGGSLGAGGNWNWYTVSCGGTYVISGATPVIYPTVTDVYYVRAEDPITTTTCVTANITVYSLPPSPTLASSSPNIICYGQSSSLNATCLLGKISWWDSPTGGIFLGSSASGVNFSVAPTTTSIYYAQDTASCGVSIVRIPDTVFVDIPASPTLVFASPDTVSCGSNTSLNATSINRVKWYTASTGGTVIGSTSSGSSLSVMPLSSPITIYFAESQSLLGCSSLSRSPDIVNVNSGTLPNPTNITATPGSICYGQNSSLNATCNPGIIKWWDSSSGGNSFGTSASGANFIVSPTVTTVYYAETFSNCGVSVSRISVTVVADVPASPFTVTASPNSISCGNSSTLIATSSFRINWYSAPSGGTAISSTTSGANYIVTPLTSPFTIYYAESFSSGGCTSISRIADSVFVAGTPDPSNVTASSTSVCPGQSSSLTATCSQGYIRWWNSSSGGTMLATRISGANYVITPTATIIYYAEAYSSCGASSRISVSVSYGGLFPPSPVTATISPCFISKSTIRNLSSGDTRENINALF